MLNIKKFVRDTFFFNGMRTVGYKYNEDYQYKDEMDYKLTDECDGEEIDYLIDNDIIYHDDDDYYHINSDCLNMFYTEKEMAEDLALWNAKYSH